MIERIHGARGSRGQVKYGSDNKGFVKGLFAILLIGVLLFIGISFAKPYYRYSILKSYSKSILEAGFGDTEKLKKRILTSADELKVPLTENNITVQQYNNTVTLKANWSEVVDLLGYYQRKLNFNIDMNMAVRN